MLVTQDEAQPALGAFLKLMRQRIPPDAVRLGANKRLPIRRGRRVTQEEMAEAVGVSRNWYRRLESGAGERPSTKLLARLAEALGLGTEERATFFALALPEIWLPTIRAVSTGAFSFPWLPWS